MERNGVQICFSFREFLRDLIVMILFMSVDVKRLNYRQLRGSICKFIVCHIISILLWHFKISLKFLVIPKSV